jgi:gas vesicle protein
MNTTAKVISGFLVGAAAGAIAGILLAPDSGRKTRAKMLEESLKFKDQLSDSFTKTLEGVKKGYNERLEEYAKSGKTSIDGLKEKMRV